MKPSMSHASCVIAHHRTAALPPGFRPTERLDGGVREVVAVEPHSVDDREIHNGLQDVANMRRATIHP
jgi:hypothetical protein